MDTLIHMHVRISGVTPLLETEDTEDLAAADEEMNSLDDN